MVATTDAESQSEGGPESIIIEVTGPKANKTVGMPSALHKTLYGEKHRRASSHETGLSSESESLHDIGRNLKPPRKLCLKYLTVSCLLLTLFCTDCFSNECFDRTVFQRMFSFGLCFNECFVRTVFQRMFSFGLCFNECFVRTVFQRMFLFAGRGRSGRRNDSQSSMASTVSASSTVDEHWHIDSKSGSRADGNYTRNITRCSTPDAITQKAYKNVTEDNDRRRPAKSRKQPNPTANVQSRVVDNPDFDEFSRLAGETLARLNKDDETAETETTNVADTASTSKE